ncbi:MAG: PmeII family type II restriction endonuclease [bacterium]|nr:PmeII family type II restriction endonuclease [bacterium]
MNQSDLALITAFINRSIDQFHADRLRLIQSLKLNDILRRKNPYLFRAKNITSPEELITSFVDATLSSSEEGLFGRFLEELAIYVNQITSGGQKSSSPGIDLEFNRDNTRYLVAIKSGLNWGNSSQHRALENNFKQALVVLRQSRQVVNAQAVLGICYGRAKDSDKGMYRRICGQRFWTFISGDPDLYRHIVEPLGYNAADKNELFQEQKGLTLKRLVEVFNASFCDANGSINWQQLVEFNSGNLNSDE